MTGRRYLYYSIGYVWIGAILILLGRYLIHRELKWDTPLSFLVTCILLFIALSGHIIRKNYCYRYVPLPNRAILHNEISWMYFTSIIITTSMIGAIFAFMGALWVFKDPTNLSRIQFAFAAFFISLYILGGVMYFILKPLNRKLKNLLSKTICQDNDLNNNWSFGGIFILCLPAIILGIVVGTVCLPSNPCCRMDGRILVSESTIQILTFDKQWQNCEVIINDKWHVRGIEVNNVTEISLSNFSSDEGEPFPKDYHIVKALVVCGGEWLEETIN